MYHLTSILRKIIKVRLKRQKYPMHIIVLRNPAYIRSKNTAHFCIFICTDTNIQMITIHPCLSLLIYFICTNINNWIMANHPFYKHHLKSPPHVTPFCIQSRTTIHTEIHLHALVHKILPIDISI